MLSEHLFTFAARSAATATAAVALAASAQASVVSADVSYYVNETFNTSVSAGSSTTETSLTTGGSFTAPSGSTMTGLAGFDSGRFFGSSTLTRAGAFSFSEVLTSAARFRDVLSIDTGGACPVGGTACQLSFSYTATGSFSATGNLSFAGQLDFAILNPDTPGDRSTWLVDHPVFLSPGAITITDSASISFFDNQSFTFWPVFGVVARQISGSNGTSTLDFSHSLVFDSFSVAAPGGGDVAFLVSAQSGLNYSRNGLTALPEPGSLWLCALAIGLLAGVVRIRAAS